MDHEDISLASLQRHIAQLYELMEQPEEAITCYQQLLAAYPDDNADNLTVRGITRIPRSTG